MSTEDENGQAETMDPGAALEVAPSVEAALLSAEKPLNETKIAAALEAAGVSCDAPGVLEAIDALNETYEQTGRSFRIERVAGGHRVMTLPAFAPAVAAVKGMRAETRLSRAAIESLSIIAYRQPVARASIESIRGVASGEVLRGLLDRKLITITGRAEELGRPLLYGTTTRFLELFGLASLTDLPPVGETLSLIGAFNDSEVEAKPMAQEPLAQPEENELTTESTDAQS